MLDCSPTPKDAGAAGGQRIMKLANAVIHIIPQVLYGFKGQDRGTGDSSVKLDWSWSRSHVGALLAMFAITDAGQFQPARCRYHNMLCSFLHVQQCTGNESKFYHPSRNGRCSKREKENQMRRQLDCTQPIRTNSLDLTQWRQTASLSTKLHRSLSYFFTANNKSSPESGMGTLLSWCYTPTPVWKVFFLGSLNQKWVQTQNLVMVKPLSVRGVQWSHRWKHFNNLSFISENDASLHHLYEGV